MNNDLVSSDNNSPDILWQPNSLAKEASLLSVFSRKVESLTGERFNSYSELHAWSVNNKDKFWDILWDYADVVGTKGRRILVDENKMPGAQFFPDARLNIAQNLLKYNTDKPAIIFRREDGMKVVMSWKELNAMVSRIQQAMQAVGVVQGDRVVGMVPNGVHAVAIMLAAASIGAVWSSCSPDFGERAVVDRFGQVKPVLFFACDGYYYNGKEINLTERLNDIAPQLGVKKTIILPFMGRARQVSSSIVNTIDFDSFIAPFSAREIDFLPLPFSHPLYILFSSGTTGVPKCIVHSAGGTLLQHLKEHRLHCGIEEGDRVFYFTTCGWMMWNWLVSALASGATIMLYDGSPFYPDAKVLFDYAQEDQFTFFGTSAKYIDAARNANLCPVKTHDLSAIKMITSTGSPLAPENFDYVYTHVKKDVHLASMSGGTDIVACFVGGVPWRPVCRGEIQGPMLAMDVHVWDEDGKPVQHTKGELVCTSPFPSMPIGFWGDERSEKYQKTYFDRFSHVWCQGDFAEITSQQGFVIHGRSDATLNPGGVRIGTAEIYNHVEKLGGIEEALCVGQEWESDTRIVLFVRLAKDVILDQQLKSIICKAIRSGASPRHVPAVIIAAPDLPRTKSGKIAELAVKEIIHGRKVTNDTALANPNSLTFFKNLPELAV